MEDVLDSANNEIGEGEESTGTICSPMFSWTWTRMSKRPRLKVWPVALAKYFRFDRIKFELKVTRSVSTGNML
jgi:hypothetical protein